MNLRIYLFFLLITSCKIASGQVAYSLQNKTLVISSCTTQIDKFTLLPSSITVIKNGATINDFKIANNAIYWSSNLCNEYTGDTIEVSYRTFGFNVMEPFYVIDTAKFKSETAPISIGGYTYTYDAQQSKLIDAPALDYRGSFTRGIAVGNGQNFSINSNFDMQLRGDLGNGLSIVAAITDENLPIQAAGNTQQLQEFDRLYIQISKDRSSLIAGDYQLNRPESYFMNYFKKLKGISFTNEDALKKGKITQKTSGSFAISNGKFGRQTIKTTEGNQGPYRISGPNGERFIIVLSGSEKVYFNGILLKRGFDFDFTIDYNRAELTFSPTRVIARDSRVIIEFEYTDISYLRSLYAVDTDVRGANWSLGAHMYTEQDSKNGTGDLVLDSLDIDILRNGGDQIENINRPGIRSISSQDRESANLILYKGIPDPDNPSGIILQFTTRIDSAEYTAIFTEVGIGKGDYIIDPNLGKNGRVYRYAGKNMGPYLPIIQLIPPEQKQLLTLYGEFRPDKNSRIKGELALSHQDRNRLSEIGNNDNKGLASWLGYDKKWKLDSLGKWTADIHTSHEYVHRDFKALNPYRNAEFVRDWNIGDLTITGEEHIIKVTTGIQKTKTFQATYTIDRYSRSKLYEGFRQLASLNGEIGRWNLISNVNILNDNAQYSKLTSQFLRANGRLSYALTKNKQWLAGVEYDGESNNRKDITTKLLRPSSYRYDFIKTFISNEVSETFGLKLAASRRVDDLFGQSNLQRAAVATELEFGGRWMASEFSDLQWNLVGRDLNIKVPELLPNDRPKRSIIGKLDYLWSAYKGSIKSNTNYNTSSGQEPKVEYVFQKVDIGQGEYVLINDSETPNLTNVQDFRYDPTNPAARFIRLSLVNNEFFRTNNMELNQNISLDPARWLLRDTILAKVKWRQNLSKITTQSNIRLTQKQAADAPFSLASYIPIDTRDSSIISYQANVNNILFINKGSIKYDAQLGQRQVRNRVTQINGVEDRGTRDFYIRARKSIGSRIDVFVNAEQNYRLYTSELLAIRNIDIKGWTIKPEINYRPTSQSRVVILASIIRRDQRILNMESAKLTELKTEYSLRKASKYSFDISTTLVNVKFDGLANSPLEYDMLDGLKDGKNYLWNVLYTYRIGKNMDLIIQYEGRKTGVAPILNIARTQLKATF